MRQWRVFLVFSLFLSLLAFGSSAAATELARDSGEGAWDERAQEHRVRAALLADKAQLAPGSPLRVGLTLAPDAHWHVYWKNSGDAGMATQVRWSVVWPGSEAPQESREVSWPAPQVFVQKGPITTYGYDGEVMHAATFTAPDTLPATGEVLVEATVDYLTCKVECIPGHQVLVLSIPLAAQDVSAAQATLERFAAHDARLPRPLSAHPELAFTARASQSALRPGDEGELRYELVTCAEDVPLADCPRLEADVEEAIEHVFVPDTVDGVEWSVKRAGALEDQRGLFVELDWRVTRTKVSTPGEPVRFAGVMKLRELGGAPLPLQITHELPMLERGAAITTQPLTTRAEPAPEAPAAVLDDSDASPAPDAPSFWYALWLAFLGGMLLNVMPCVFPVLSIKIAGIAQIAHQERGEMVRHGLAYMGGILCAMWALGFGVLAMRLFGMEAGWGFQFQSPLFILFLIGVLTLFAANLFGAFEIGTPMGSELQAAADRMAQQGGRRQSFFEGLLCVLLATPCSAPFMGTAVGFALSSDALVILAIFTMLGVGLALPFVVLCAAPGWARFLPKPGAWLGHLKWVLGMCLLATCIWLLWLLGQSQGVSGVALTLGWMWGIAALGRIYGWVQYGAPWPRRALLMVSAALVLGAGWWLGTQQEEAAPEVAQGVAQEARPGEIAWRVFDEQDVAQQVAQGKIVFVDFTADWCITCKVNERGVLTDPELLARAEALGVVWYKADWTRRDETIRKILRRHGKGGVPMYLVYGKESAPRGKLLPELLTRELVLEAFAQEHRSKQ